jgi:hypothetical protein
MVHLLLTSCFRRKHSLVTSKQAYYDLAECSTRDLTSLPTEATESKMQKETNKLFIFYFLQLVYQKKYKSH